MNESTLKEKTAKGLFWGGIGGGIQQLFSVIFGVVFARILNQEDYGMVGVLAIFMAIASTIQEGGFTAGLINRKEIRHEDYNAVFWFSFLTGSGMYLLLFFCAPLIARFFDAPVLVPLSRVLFLWFLIGSIGIAPNAMLQKELKIKERTLITTVSLLLSNGVGLFLIVNGYGYWGLVIQTVVYSIVGTSMIWYYSSFRPSLRFNIQPLKEMFPFSIMLVLTGFVGQINANILSVFLGRFFTKHEVGDYAQGNKWATIGSTFINNMLQGIVHPVLVEANNDIDRQRNIFRKMLRFIAFVSFPAMFGLAFVSHELIVILITDKWLMSIVIMQLFCIWGAFLPINTLYGLLLFAHGKSRIYLWNTILIGLIQVFILICIHPLGIIAMIKAFVAINFLWLFIWHYFVHKLIHIRLFDVFADIFPYLLITVATMVVAYYATSFIHNLYVLLFSKIAITVVLYILVMRISNSVIYKESYEYLKQMIKR